MPRKEKEMHHYPSTRKFQRNQQKRFFKKSTKKFKDMEIPTKTTSFLWKPRKQEYVS